MEAYSAPFNIRDNIARFVCAAWCFCGSWHGRLTSAHLSSHLQARGTDVSTRRRAVLVATLRGRASLRTRRQAGLSQAPSRRSGGLVGLVSTRVYQYLVRRLPPRPRRPPQSLGRIRVMKDCNVPATCLPATCLPAPVSAAATHKHSPSPIDLTCRARMRSRARR